MKPDLPKDFIIDCAHKAAESTPAVRYPVDTTVAERWAMEYVASPHTHSKEGDKTTIRTGFERRLASLLERTPEPTPEPTAADPVKILPETEAVENRPFLRGRPHTIVSPGDRFLRSHWTKETFLATGNPRETLGDLVERITPDILRGNCPLTDIDGNPISLKRTSLRKIQKSASQGKGWPCKANFSKIC